MVVATATVDFDLSVQPPRDGFRFIRHPESFRASLTQVSIIIFLEMACEIQQFKESIL